MENLHFKIKAYLEKNSKTENELYTNIKLENNGDGDFISFWNVNGLSKPTDEQLNAFDTEAKKFKDNDKADANRQTEYGSWEEQLDYIYHNGITKWKTDHIKPIKDKYPKE